MLTLREISDTATAVAHGLDIQRIYLFGSYARNEATENSDVDLCLESGPTFSLFNAGDFAISMETALKVPVDIVTERSLFPRVREKMLAERILVYER